MNGRRELVLASAGAGKTFRISTRIIALLDAGTPPREVLASTFTRKAAGEILERVLGRLATAALTPEEAGRLAGSVAAEGFGSPDPGEDPDHWLGLLRSLSRELHRTNVGTLDAFFVRAARSFTPELGLPPAWGVADRPTADRLASDALQDVLRDADTGETVEMVRMLQRGDAARSVHRRLLDQVSELREVLRQIDSGAEDPWRPFGSGREVGPAAACDVEDLVTALEAVDLPTVRSGDPDGRFVSAVQRGIEHLRSADWESFCTGGLAAKVLDGSLAYHGKDLPGPLVACLRRCIDEARKVLVERFHRQSTAMGRLAVDFDRALSRRQREEGAYGFHDLTHLLGSGDAVTGRSDLWYRLDGRVRHLLLDEFQDTSLAQWEALRPLADGLLRSGGSDPDGGGAEGIDGDAPADGAAEAVDGDGPGNGAGGSGAGTTMLVVADPKQSIYGWRGARPDLVHRVGRRFGMEKRALEYSWRSSGEVLGLVNDVFTRLAESAVWAAVDDEERELGDREVAGEWIRDFRPHRPAPPLEDAPGHVRIEAGPREEDTRKTARPKMMAYASRRIAEIHRDIPEASIGVLVRHNEAVAHLILALRDEGVRASERSGTRLTDSSAVAGILALLRMADHPGDTVQRYHVARSPVGPMVGFFDHRDRRAARRTAESVRRRFLSDGYGRTLFGWVRTLCDGEVVDRRGVGRLLQLVELGYRWDERATLRPGDFVRSVEAERMEDPQSAPIRVMTIHQAKGLEFDLVVLPELDFSLTGTKGGGPTALPERDPETGRVLRVFPYVRRGLRPLLEEVGDAASQSAAARLRDSLGLLYVGLTRARYAVHLLLPADHPDRGPAPRCTPDWVLRHAFGLVDPVAAGDTLLDRGDPRWHRVADVTLEHEGEAGGEPEEPAAGEAWIPLRRTGRRTRFVPHRSPSSLEGGGEVDLGRTLHLRGAVERTRGTVAHAWFEAVGWIEIGIPEEARLREIARREAPSLDEEDVERLLRRFHDWIDLPDIRALLSRGEYPDGAEVENEVPFAHRSEEHLVRGAIDRLVVWKDERGPAGEITDFKTDALEPGDRGALEEGIARYRDQIEAYRTAISAGRGIPPERLRAQLVFLEAGTVERV